MKVLFLNCSPRKNGNTAGILRQIEANIAKNHAVEWVDVNNLAIKPCTGCLRCRPDRECALPEDDAQRIGRIISQADVLIVGTPTYWGNMTGALKNLFDRSVTVFEYSQAGSFPKPRQKGKKAVIVTTSGAPWPYNQLSSQSRGTIRAIKTVLKNGGYRITGIINYGGATTPEKIPVPVLQRAQKIGGRL